jgi:hypothetical protein
MNDEINVWLCVIKADEPTRREKNVVEVAHVFQVQGDSFLSVIAKEGSYDEFDEFCRT